MPPEELMCRRSVLALMGLVPLGLAQAYPGGVWVSQEKADPTRSLDAVAQGYQDLYGVADPSSLLIAVNGHLRTLSAVLSERSESAERALLLASYGRSSLLAGRLAFFDLGDAHAGRGHLTAALEAAGEAADPLLAAGVLGHVAFIASAHRNVGAALDYLSGADALAQGSAGAGVRSWLAAAEAEVRTRAGDRLGAWRSIDRAEALSRDARERPPGWFDFYHAGRLDGFRGDSYQAFGRFADARSSLERGMASLSPQSPKQRAVLLADLASAELQEGDVEQACTSAASAVDVLRTSPYATGFDRLRRFRRRLEGLGQRQQVRELDEQMSVL